MPVINQRVIPKQGEGAVCSREFVEWWLGVPEKDFRSCHLRYFYSARCVFARKDFPTHINISWEGRVFTLDPKGRGIKPSGEVGPTMFRFVEPGHDYDYWYNFRKKRGELHTDEEMNRGLPNASN